jgi:SAM-dependent methyltransferase
MSHMQFAETEIQNFCPVCSNKTINHWSAATDLLLRVSSQTFDYSRCISCDTLFMSNRPKEECVSVFYGSNYHPYQASLDKKGKTIFKKVLRKIKSFLSLTKDPLTTVQKNFYDKVSSKDVFVDFGCGAGKFLNQIQSTGCQTVGVDFSPYAIEAVLKNNHKGYTVDEFWTSFGNQSVNFVRMNHVAEHLYHPHEVFTNLATKFVREGYFHLAVPNPNGISSKLFKRNWHGLDCPRHVILYTPESLKQLLLSHGFKDFTIVHESITKDLVRSIGYFLASIKMMKLEKVETLINSVFLDLVFMFPMKAFARLGYGDRFHVFCRKA